MGHGGPGRLTNMDIFWLVDVQFAGTLGKCCLRKLTLKRQALVLLV